MPSSAKPSLKGSSSSSKPVMKSTPESSSKTVMKSTSRSSSKTVMKRAKTSSSSASTVVKSAPSSSSKSKPVVAVKSAAALGLSGAQRTKALKYVEEKMECLTDQCGNIEVCEHKDLLLRLIKDPSLDATTEVLELFEPSKKKGSLPAKELDKMVDDTENGKHLRTGFCEVDGGSYHYKLGRIKGLSVFQVRDAANANIEYAAASFQGPDAFRVCARLLGVLVDNSSGCIRWNEDGFEESIIDCMELMLKLPDLTTATAKQFGTAKQDIERAIPAAKPIYEDMYEEKHEQILELRSKLLKIAK